MFLQSTNPIHSIFKRGVSSLAQKFQNREWRETNVQREFLDELGKRIGIKKFEDWYNVKKTDFIEHGGSKILSLYSSHIQAISIIYSEYDWLMWKFNGVPRSFWDKLENQKKFIKHVEKELDIKNKEDWYQVVGSDIQLCGGGYLIHKYYQSSLYKLLVATIPDYQWLPWKFNSANTKDFWKDSETQRIFFDSMGKELGYETMEDWYKIRDQDIINHYGSKILEIYGSASNAVVKVFHSYPWKIWKFEQLERGFWSHLNHQRQYIEYLSKELEIKDWKEWYKVTVRTFVEYDGAGFICYFGYSTAKALMTALPEYPWDPLLFPSRDKWGTTENLRTRMDQISKILNIKNFEDWYQFQTEDITENGGDIIIQKFGGSLHKLLQATYPEYNFDALKFASRPKYLFQTIESQRRFFDGLMEKWSMNRLEDWYTISKLDIVKAGGFNIIRKYGGIPQTLSQLYPHFPWDWERSKIPGGITKTQQRIFKFLIEMLPNESIHQNFNYEARFPETNRLIQLDIFIPSLKIALEYQGEQHYKETLFGSLDKRQKKDNEKRELCREAGIKLIEIPFWWDGTKEQLASLIKSEVPEALNNKS